MKLDPSDVPDRLRFWFVVHFVVDMLFGIPLLLFPDLLLSILNWTEIDPIMTRLVGAALVAIGVESLLGRNASAEVYRAMLNLKILWASGAILAFILGMASGGPSTAWIFVVVFFAFLCLWVYYRLQLR